MSDAAYWNRIWDNYQSLPVSDFAKEVCRLIQTQNLVTLLELGCGNGQDALYFAQNGLQVTAIDYSQSGINHIKALNSQITCLLKDLRDLDFPDNSFDAVYAHLSLHYFDDKTTVQIFRNIYRIMKKGGIFFVKCKSTEDRLYGQGEKVGEDMFLKDHIRHFFSREYMAEKLISFETVHLKKTAATEHEGKSAFIEAIAVK